MEQTVRRRWRPAKRLSWGECQRRVRQESANRSWCWECDSVCSSLIASELDRIGSHWITLDSIGSHWIELDERVSHQSLCLIRWTGEGEGTVYCRYLLTSPLAVASHRCLLPRPIAFSLLPLHRCISTATSPPVRESKRFAISDRRFSRRLRSDGWFTVEFTVEFTVRFTVRRSYSKRCLIKQKLV